MLRCKNTKDMISCSQSVLNKVEDTKSYNIVIDKFRDRTMQYAEGAQSWVVYLFKYIQSVNGLP